MAMKQIKKRPVALTVAGSDSGGGAGIQADLKTFAAFDVHDTCAITSVTAQNPRRVLAVEGVSPHLVRQQIEAVFAELPPSAVKTGMLFSAQTVGVVADFFKASPRKKTLLVVDPVMVATSGATLLPAAAIDRLRNDLLPLATLVTPNISEAVILAGQEIESIEDMRRAAKRIHSQFGCAVLLKGGHLPASPEVADIFFDGRTELMLAAPRVSGIRTHGTGCTYSAAVCAALALGYDLPWAVQIAKQFISRAIAGSYRVGGHFALNPFALKPKRLRPGRRLREGSGR
jgi:hydroxymethylpyrimidine kinase/phosphomethylpyrimidine kinase